jgi:anti-sigma regulatory factor (Ser/Thr protein kinase)
MNLPAIIREPGPPVLRMHLANSLRSLAQASETVRAFLRSQLVSDASTNQILLIVDELVSNVIRHACSDRPAHVLNLALALEPGNGEVDVTLIFEDDGVAFDPTQVPEPPPVTNLDDLDDLDPGGLGLPLVRRMSQHLAYDRVAGRNRILLRKRAVLVSGDDDARPS